jgi:2-methylcitrate dehydratase PrpD
MGVAAGDIERVRVKTYRAALEVAGYDEPRTAAEARFSLKYVVATALTHGDVRFAAFEPGRIADPATRDLMRRVEVAVDPELDAAFPARRAARIGITTRGGRSEELLQPTRVGDPEAPLSDSRLEGKYLEFAVPVLGVDRARRLLGQLWRLEREAKPNPL